MINYILLDIDGCITDGKNKPVDLVALQALKQSIHQAKATTGLCTGRSALYVEAIAQMLDIKSWCICENGAYLYHTQTEDIVYHPSIQKSDLSRLAEIKQRLLTDTQYTGIAKLEIGKEVCISLNPINMSIEALYQTLQDTLDLTGLHIAHSTTAVDITPQSINKGSALKLLCNQEYIALEDCIGVGDTMGDMPFLVLCGQVACPNNAIEDIKEIASFVSMQSSTQGLIEIYDWISKQ